MRGPAAHDLGLRQTLRYGAMEPARLEPVSSQSWLIHGCNSFVNSLRGPVTWRSKAEGLADADGGIAAAYLSQAGWSGHWVAHGGRRASCRRPVTVEGSPRCRGTSANVSTLGKQVAKSCPGPGTGQSHRTPWEAGRRMPKAAPVVRQKPYKAEGFVPDTSGSSICKLRSLTMSLASPVDGWHCVCAPSS